MKKVMILDYGNGNANSIKSALTALGAESVYSSRAVDIAKADYIILPGVGHHGSAMEVLHDRGLIVALKEAVLVQHKPVLGICLGMQLMTQLSEESQLTGLGWVNAVTRKIVTENKIQFKVPHVGWNIVSNEPSSVLLQGIPTADEPFYFCHGFAINAIAEPAVISMVQYDKPYVAIFEKDNIFGVQFHPEKSQDSGLKLIQNFLSTGA
jgi:imidazole glycerol-phosphate synthase subunit HisH